MKLSVPKEWQEQMRLFEWAALVPEIRDVIIHIANEYAGGSKGGRIRRLLGVKKGVSDIFLAYPTKTRHGLWIELKRLKGSKVTEEQKNWISRMKKFNYGAEICYGFEEAVSVIKNYLLDNKELK